MKFKDSVLIAYTKYRTKRVRSVLSVIGAAFLLSMLLFLTLGGTGIRNTIVNNSVSANTGGKSLAAANNYMDPSAETDLTYEVALTAEKNRLNLAEIKYENLYTSVNLAGYGNSVIESDDLATTLAYGAPAYLEMVDHEMMQPYTNQNEEVDFTRKTDSGAIPALISIDLLTEKYSPEINKYDSATEKQKVIESYKNDLKNKDIIVKMKTYPPETGQSYSTTATEQKPAQEYTIKIRVVGFLPSSSSFVSSFGGGGYLPPQIQLPRTVAINEDFALSANTKPPTIYIASFGSKEDRNKLVDTFADVASYNISPYTPYADPIAAADGMYQVIRNAFKFFVIVMLLFVTLPMSGTISKILADSQRETGVFRAIGARNRDIYKIYLVYSGLLATIAFVVAFAIASLLCFYLTARYSANFAGELSMFSGGATSYKVLFYGINPTHLLFLYALILFSAMLGVLGPVMRTLRKDPVVAMRED